jgi:trk system potassium uptake protein TrkH
MFLAGTNFTLLYFLLKGRFKRVWSSQEFRAYASGIFLVVILVTLLLFVHQGTFSEVSFREVLFQVVSVITTTGFVTADYTSWGLATTFVFFLLLFAGGSAGSTSGGVKVIRHLVFLKNTFLEFKRILHPRAMIRIKIDNNLVAPRVLTHVMVFILIYLAIFGIGTLFVTATGVDLITSAGAVAASLGNVGPAIGGVGPMDNFSGLPSMAKWILSFLMIMGRLELFTFLVLFTPFYWRNN